MYRENKDSCDQDERTCHAADDSINSELLEKKDPAISQHENNAAGIHSDASEHANPRPDERDPDADRRTLDEEKPVEDDDEEDN